MDWILGLDKDIRFSVNKKDWASAKVLERSRQKLKDKFFRETNGLL